MLDNKKAGLLKEFLLRDRLSPVDTGLTRFSAHRIMSRHASTSAASFVRSILAWRHRCFGNNLSNERNITPNVTCEPHTPSQKEGAEHYGKELHDSLLLGLCRCVRGRSRSRFFDIHHRYRTLRWRHSVSDIP